MLRVLRGHARDENVPSFLESGLQHAKILAHKPAQPAAGDGVAHLGRHREPDLQTAAAGIYQYHIPRGIALSLAVHGLIITVSAEAVYLSAKPEGVTFARHADLPRDRQG